MFYQEKKKEKVRISQSHPGNQFCHVCVFNFARVAYFCSFLTIRIKEMTMPFGIQCETSSSQPRIGQYCRLCTLFMFPDWEMLRWYLTFSELTAFNQFLAHQDPTGPLLKLSARYRVNFNNINSLHTSCLLFASMSIVYDLFYWYWWFSLSIFAIFSKPWTNFIFSIFLLNACFWILSHIHFC